MFRKVEAVVPPETISGSNTSVILATTLQMAAVHPERFPGIRPGEPAHLTRFMKIICDQQTELYFAERGCWSRTGGTNPPSSG